MNSGPLLGNERIILVAGPGGVGKTTLAASLGVQLALQGHRTLILTVDPARRLAQALGFKDFSSDLQPVPLPEGTPGTLHATMLDAQRYFDRIVDRFAQSEEQRQTILANPLYRTMVKSLGGTHEYAAMERLFEFSEDPAYDRIVVDTPPTQNAVDLLSAPQRLADFMDNSVLRWFQGPKPIYLKLFQTGTKVAMKLLQRVFGSDFLAAFGTFMDAIDGMQAGFRKRNLEVLELLRSPASAFLLVTLPTEGRYLETEDFSKTLETSRIHLKGIILNRIQSEVPLSPEDIAKTDPATRDSITRWLAYENLLYRNQRRVLDKFAARFTQIPTRLVPLQADPPQDVASLSQLGRLLVK
jgi:anion-transporting  ArsA/GET3 family ATPase